MKLQPRTFVASNAGLLAANLLTPGNTAISQPLPTKEPAAFAGKLIAVYPMLTPDTIRMTMDNYRVWEDEYNTATGFENISTENHNAEVRRFLASDQANETHKAYDDHFKKSVAFREKNDRKKLTDREYNAEADEICAQHGPIIFKRKIQTIKTGSEAVFENMLYYYNEQLMYKNKQRQNARNTNPLPLPAFAANSWRISQRQRANGMRSLRVCNKTVCNHRARLEEAGVFINGRFRGKQTAYEVDFNPKILVAFDQFNDKIVAAENQSLNQKTRKVLRMWSGNTSTSFRDKLDKKGNSTEFPDKESVTPTAFTSPEHGHRYKALGKERNSPVGAAAESVKISIKPEKSPSDKMAALVLPVNELDARLRIGLFDGYEPIKPAHLRWEAYNGTLTNLEFKEVMLQERLKIAAKLYIGTRITPGTWANTFKMLKDDLWITLGHTWSKAAILQDFESYTWRINHAVRWFKNKTINPLYPSKYFDVRRRKKEEMGFEYTIQAYKSHLAEPERRKKRQAKRQKEAAKRVPEIDLAKKYKAKVAEFQNGKITIYQLSDYVQHYLPAEFYKKLADYLHTRSIEETNRKYNA